MNFQLTMFKALHWNKKKNHLIIINKIIIKIKLNIKLILDTMILNLDAKIAILFEVEKYF